MRTIHVTCPACNKALDVPADQVGEKVECPECYEEFTAEKPESPKIRVVFTHGSSGKAGKGKKSKRQRDDDDDDDDDLEYDDDEDYGPPRGHAGGPSGALPLTLGILSLLLCVPPFGLVLAIAAIVTGRADRHPDPSARGIAFFGRLLGQITVGLYLLAVGVVVYMIGQK